MSGIGSTGSFQLVDNFIPSPAILAGESDDERAERVIHFKEDKETSKYDEVYIVRKTKSGRLGGSAPKGSSASSSTSSSKRRR